MTVLESRERIRGCLLGGAIGDALGAPVEFWSREQIEQAVGPLGVREYLPVQFGASAGVGLVTDDTQMTLFTVEGLIRAHVRWTQRGICHPPSVVHHAYQRWLTTQELSEPPGAGLPVDDPRYVDGWLGQEAWLYSRRAPGLTCLTSLSEGRGGGFGGVAGNSSKGCGGVMRSTPFGLMQWDDPAEMSMACAALTHGHPTGQISSGALALIIGTLMGGRPLAAAVEVARDWAQSLPGGAETDRALGLAVELARAGGPSAESVRRQGEGWIAEEALGIAVHCALAFDEPDEFMDALSLAVTHGGDSDSTGAICGGILGALHGDQVLPVDLLAGLEGRATITQLADDLATLVERPGVLVDGFAGVSTIVNDEWLRRYPGW